MQDHVTFQIRLHHETQTRRMRIAEIVQYIRVTMASTRL